MDVSTPRQSSAVPSTAPSNAPARAPAPAPPPNPGPAGKPFAGVLAASRARLARGAHPPSAAHAKGPERAGTSESKAPAPAPALEGEQGARGGRDSDSESGRDGDDMKHAGTLADGGRELELLDPAARHAASLAPPALASPTSAAAVEAPLRARSLEELLPALVRRIAWAGDKHRGTVRLELGAGAYAGTTVVVHADGGRVRVEISGSEGPDLDRLRARLDGRLRGHGLDVESVT